MSTRHGSGDSNDQQTRIRVLVGSPWDIEIRVEQGSDGPEAKENPNVELPEENRRGLTKAVFWMSARDILRALFDFFKELGGG